MSAFPRLALGTPFGAPSTSGANGAVTVNLPVGTQRFGFDVFSTATAQTFPGLVNIERTPGTAMAHGVMFDCQHRQISNFIATVSRTAGAPDHVEGADTYYFSTNTKKPVRHEEQRSSGVDGQFLVLELVPTSGTVIQIWGYPTAADLAADRLTLVGEIPVLLLDDTLNSAARAAIAPTTSGRS